MKIKAAGSILISMLVLSACAFGGAGAAGQSSGGAKEEAPASAGAVTESPAVTEAPAKPEPAAETKPEPVTGSDTAAEPAAEPAAVTEQPSSSEEESLISRAVTEAGAKPEDARYSIVYDFDGDASAEAFVFIGEALDEDVMSCLGDVWFVGKDSCERVQEGRNLLFYNDALFHLFPEEGSAFVVFDEAYATESISFVYTVKNGKPVESSISGRGAFYSPADTEDYCMTVALYDGSLQYEKGKEDEAMGMGHTWKRYYFYYDKAQKDFKEYVAAPITEEELTAACGFDLAGEIRKEGYQVDGILRRENGIIHVNYSLTTEESPGSFFTEYKNANFNEKTGEFLDVWETGEKTWQNSDFGGIYLEKIL